MFPSKPKRPRAEWFPMVIPCSSDFFINPRYKPIPFHQLLVVSPFNPHVTPWSFSMVIPCSSDPPSATRRFYQLFEQLERAGFVSATSAREAFEPIQVFRGLGLACVCVFFWVMCVYQTALHDFPLISTTSASVVFLPNFAQVR